MKPIQRISLLGGIALMLILTPALTRADNALTLQTEDARISIDTQGCITSIQSRASNHEYLAPGHKSPVLSLSAKGRELPPLSLQLAPDKNQVVLTFSNGAAATVRIESKGRYVRLQLLSLENRGEVDNILWGPVHTTISKTIGDIIGVVRDEDWAIGMLALDDITIQGPPVDSDFGQMYYYIHSPDPVKFPVPDNFKEGQRFTIGGDGYSDVAFYSHPEEYFRMGFENAAQLEPGSGSVLTFHARDRRSGYTSFYTLIPGMPPTQPRHQVVEPLDVDFMGSSVALFACPDARGLSTIENIVLGEGLPHPMIDGKWVKDPSAFRPDIAWYGPHDRLIEYANALGLKGVQDEGMGEYYIDPADPWDGPRVGFKDGRKLSIREFTDLTRQHGIRYGLHTLCLFVLESSSDARPVPNPHLQTVLRTKLAANISAEETQITVTDPSFLAEKGCCHENQKNVLRIGTELLTYDGISDAAPWTLKAVKRGINGTRATAHAAGDELVKLQINCYHGFVPDMKLMLDYADLYAKRLSDLGMEYIDFDGFESCMYQNHGDYAFKIFCRRLFDTYSRLTGGKYLRLMGSTICEGNWHYMSVCNVGGGNHMFDPVLNRWGIEGKDIRYQWASSYFPITFGIQDYHSDWTVYDAENLQAKSIGFDGLYMLGLSQNAVERSGEKEAIFKAFRLWEHARETGVFTDKIKKQLADLNYKFHLEMGFEKTLILHPVRELRETVRADGSSQILPLRNPFDAQKMEFAIQLRGPDNATVQGMKITLPDRATLATTNILKSGQFIIVKDNRAYVADRNRNATVPLSWSPSATLPAGESTVAIETIAPTAPGESRLEFTTWALGPGQILGK
jgi:hypothetical protein